MGQTWVRWLLVELRVCVCDSSVAEAHRLRFGEVLFLKGKLGVITRSRGVGARATEKPDVHIQRRWVS